MSSAKECVAEALETLNVLRGNQQQIILKEEQEVGVEKLLLGQDVLAVLLTGYGKSMIFTVFALAKQLMKRTEKDISTSILIISPLTSITADQITEMQSLGFDAVELSEQTTTGIIRSPPQFVYSSAEHATERKFLEALKDHSGLLHQRVSLIVADSHTISNFHSYLIVLCIGVAYTLKTRMPKRTQCLYFTN